MTYIHPSLVQLLTNKYIPSCRASDSVIDHRWRQNVVKEQKKSANELQASWSLVFLPHFDVFCDL